VDAELAGHARRVVRAVLERSGDGVTPLVEREA
jgi:hypothetical protein